MARCYEPNSDHKICQIGVVGSQPTTRCCCMVRQAKIGASCEVRDLAGQGIVNLIFMCEMKMTRFMFGSYHGWILSKLNGCFGFLFGWLVAVWRLGKSTNSHLGCSAIFGCSAISCPARSLTSQEAPSFAWRTETPPRVLRLSCNSWPVGSFFPCKPSSPIRCAISKVPPSANCPRLEAKPEHPRWSIVDFHVVGSCCWFLRERESSLLGMAVSSTENF